MPTPPDKQQLNIYITAETRALLEQIKDAEGIPYAKQVEMAMKKWALEVKGLPSPGAKRRPPTTTTTELAEVQHG